MTLRDFLKANRALIEFKKLYHERSKTKITYRQIEANLLTAKEDFIKKTLNLTKSPDHYKGSRDYYWIILNSKWSSCYAANEIKKNTDKTLGSWLKIKGIEENFRKAFLNQYPRDTERLDELLKSTGCSSIGGAFTWCNTSEGHAFWNERNLEWRDFCIK